VSNQSLNAKGSSRRKQGRKPRPQGSKARSDALKRGLLPLIFLFGFATGLLGQSLDSSKAQPAGIIGALEFTDIQSKSQGEGSLGQQAYLGLYYKLSSKFVGVAVGEYGENPIASHGRLIVKSLKFTVTYDLFSWQRPFRGSFFLIGAVGKSWLVFEDVATADISTFLNSTGLGIKFPVQTGYVAFHFRLDNSEPYKQWLVGIDYALPFYINK